MGLIMIYNFFSDPELPLSGPLASFVCLWRRGYPQQPDIHCGAVAQNIQGIIMSLLNFLQFVVFMVMKTTNVGELA